MVLGGFRSFHVLVTTMLHAAVFSNDLLYLPFTWLW